MKYDLFISDFDETLGHNQDIDLETVEAIKEYTLKGGIFAVCSGRHFNHLKGILRKYQIEGIVAVCQGAEIRDIKTQNILLQGGIDYKTAAEIAKLLVIDGLHPNAYVDGTLYHQGYSPYAEHYKSMNTELPVKETLSLEKTILDFKQTVLKLTVFEEQNKIPSLIKKYTELFKGKIVFNSGGMSLLEVINPKYGKGRAVKFIADYYKIPLDKVIAVGDSTNDLELVSSKEWHGVAVGDAVEELKIKASEITVPFRDKPVKYLLEKYCL